MQWDHIKVFLAVAREGSASAAARVLGINHATVLRRLEQLEQDLQVRLVDHLQSGYQITKQGENILSYAEQMEDGALALMRHIKGAETVPTGKLRVSQPENAFIDLSLALHAFHQAFPQIELEINATPTVSNLNRLESDVAIRLTNTPPDLLVGREITKIQFAAYASAAYMEKFKRSPKPQQCDWLLWSGTDSSQIPEARNPDRLLLAEIPNARVILRSNSMAEILAGVKNGMGVGLLSSPTADNCEGLVRLPFDKLLKKVKTHHAGLWVLTHRDLRHSARVSTFMNFMSTELSKIYR